MLWFWLFTVTMTGKQTTPFNDGCVLVLVILQYIPHLIADRKQDICTVLPAKHIITICNTTDKVGTNHSALKSPAV